MTYRALARSTCIYCSRVIETDVEPPADGEPADSVVWTAPPVPGLTGRDRECHAAPNPDDGPMPGHAPGVIARRSEQPPPPPRPYPAPVVPVIPRST